MHNQFAFFFRHSLHPLPAHALNYLLPFCCLSAHCPDVQLHELCQTIRPVEALRVELILADDHLCHLDEFATQMEERLAELVVLLHLSGKREGSHFSHLMLELLQKCLAAVIEADKLLLRLLQLSQ